jgi:uncharacterized protein Yka (UPF0111/DUF47 family)
MENDRAELSALATSLDDLTARVTAAADRLRGTPRADVSDGLYEVERSLLSASRKLDQVVRSMR